MFKKTNKQPNIQSSESDISSDNENQTQNRHHKHQHQQRQRLRQRIQYTEQKQQYGEEEMDEEDDEDNEDMEDDEDGHRVKAGKHQDDDSEMSDDEEDQITWGKDKPINMGINQGNKGKSGIHIQQQQEEDDEEDEEDEEDDEQEDSLDAGDLEYRNKNVMKGIHTIRQDPKQNMDDQDSIDHIQQRIKKLQKDLQTRLNKHKDKDDKTQKNHGKIVSKMGAHPPIPQKRPVSAGIENKMNNVNVNTSHKLQQEKKSDKGEERSLHDRVVSAGQPILIRQAKQAKQFKQTVKQKKSKKQQNPQIRQPKHEPKPSPKHESNHTQHQKPQPQQQRKKPKQSKQPQPQTKPLFTDSVQSRDMQQKLHQMSKQIKQLKLENQVLKQKLDSSEKMKKDKNKNRTLDQLQKIKEAGDKNGGDSMTKLEKQIQLLEVIDKLQAKLKKSISRKLAKQQGSTGTNLMHKGLPASMQNYI